MPNRKKPIHQRISKELRSRQGLSNTERQQYRYFEDHEKYPTKEFMALPSLEGIDLRGRTPRFNWRALLLSGEEFRLVKGIHYKGTSYSMSQQVYRKARDLHVVVDIVEKKNPKGQDIIVVTPVGRYEMPEY